jgi:MFS family permease
MGFTVATLPWVTGSFAITLAGLLLFSGRLADRFGPAPVLACGIGLFSASSLLAGLAPTQVWLICGRVTQGAGAAAMATACLALLSSTFTDPVQRMKAFGLWGAAAGSGGAIGVLAGGVIVEFLGWRWTLLINVPIGIALLILLVGAIRAAARARTAGPARRESLDGLGCLVFSLSVAALTLGAMTVSTPMGPLPWWAWITIAVVGLGLFVLVETFAAKSPLVPFGLLTRAGAWGGALVMLCVGGALSATFFFLALNIQLFHGENPLITGLMFLPCSGLSLLGGALGHIPARRFGVGPVTVTGICTMAIGLVGMAASAGLASPVVLLVASGAFGLGFGTALPRIADSFTAALPPRLSGVAAGVFNTANHVGTAVGLGIASSVGQAVASTGYASALWAAAGLALIGATVLVIRTARHRAASSTRAPELSEVS